LALAAPLALALSAGRFSAIGVLPARMSAIESLATAKIAAFDKTGTLTMPRAALVEGSASGRLDSASALNIAAALEAHSVHPIARAILAASKGRRMSASALTHHAGQGISGVVEGRRWWLGAPSFAAGSSILADGNGEDRLAILLTDREGSRALLAFAEEN